MSKPTHRRLVYSLAVILVWLGFVTEGSHALFSDAATLSSNTITTGSTDLLISNSQAGSSSLFADTRVGFPHTLSPGQGEDKYFFLKNVSSSAISLDIDVFTIAQGAQSGLFDSSVIEFTPVDSEGTVTGPTTSTTLASNVSRHLNLATSVNQGQAQRFKMRTSLAANFNQQNQNISYDLLFTGTQHLDT